MPAVYRRDWSHDPSIISAQDAAGFVTINVVDALGNDALVSLRLNDALKLLRLLAEEIATIDQDWNGR